MKCELGVAPNLEESFSLIQQFWILDLKFCAVVYLVVQYFLFIKNVHGLH